MVLECVPVSLREVRRSAMVPQHLLQIEEARIDGRFQGTQLDARGNRYERPSREKPERG